jgi:hypothetical protein
MTRKIIISIAILISFKSKLLAQEYDNCTKNHEMVFYKTEIPATFQGSLEKYFATIVTQETNNKDCTILIKILCTKKGKVCCAYIQNNQSLLKSDDLKDLINRMPDWKSAIQNGVMVDFMIHLTLEIQNKTLKVFYENGK